MPWEWRHRLAPLEFPTDAEGLAAADAQRYPAVQQFSERAAAAADEFVLRDSDVPALVEICRKLDGVPLALELAAAHVGVLGVKGLAERLDDRLALLIQGRRTALPRHQTLRATLNWSYDLLPPTEQAILRRLAAFQGEFTMDAASAVAADPAITPDGVVNAIANLVDKSLIAADIGGEVTYYHLLEMTRSYARERLLDSGEYGSIMGLHTAHFLAVFSAAEAGADVRPKEEWLRDYGRHIGNLRAALDWAFGSGGNVALGVALAAAAADFWVAISLLGECCDWSVRAIGRLGAAEGTRDEMRLQCSLGQSFTYSKGMRLDAKAALNRALTLAEGLAELNYQIRIIYALYLFDLRVLDLREAIAMCRRCETLAASTGHRVASASADLMFGIARYYLAEHATAAGHLRRARATYPPEMRGGDPIRYGANLGSNSLCYLSVAFWSLGLVDQAYQAGREAVAEARKVDHPASLSIALAAPSSIFLVKMGDLGEAEHCIDELIQHSERSLAYALRSVRPVLERRVDGGAWGPDRGGTTAAHRPAALARCGRTTCSMRSFRVNSQRCSAPSAGSKKRGSRSTRRFVTLNNPSHSGACRSCSASRESCWREATARTMRKRGCSGRAIWPTARARCRGSCAPRRASRGSGSIADSPTEGRMMLAEIYDRFTEGFSTADLLAAKELLARISQP